MSVPYYVSPEQIIADKAEFARKGIARGRSVIVASAQDAVYMVADNPSRALHKLGEIYDRIGFAAVGKYNEFENLRVAGVRLADTRGSRLRSTTCRQRWWRWATRQPQTTMMTVTTRATRTTAMATTCCQPAT